MAHYCPRGGAVEAAHFPGQSSGATGLARLQSFYQRIHGPAIAVTLGAGCILIASMVYFTVTQSRLVIHELLISVFVLMTAPVVAMMIMRAAYYRDQRESDQNSTDPTTAP